MNCMPQFGDQTAVERSVVKRSVSRDLTSGSDGSCVHIRQTEKVERERVAAGSCFPGRPMTIAMVTSSSHNQH